MTLPSVAPPQSPLEFPKPKGASIAFRVFYSISIVVGSLIILGVLGLLFLESPQGALISSVTALLPLSILFFFYRWLDNYEPEPWRNLALAFAWGALVSTGFSITLNTLNSFILPETVVLAIGAPIVEETAKTAFLFLLFFWKRHDLDGIVDGIVYAGFVAAGFAFVENILYFTNSWIGIPGPTGEDLGISGTTGLVLTFVMRGLVSPFAHPLFTAVAGVAIGWAVTSRNPWVKVLAPIGGLLGAMMLHGLWNGSTVIAGGVMFLVVYFVIMLPLFICYIAFAIVQKRKLAERLWYSLHHASSQGLLPAQDIAWLAVPAQRKQALQASKAFGQRNAQNAQKYQRAATQFGFLHYKALQGVAPKDVQARADYLLHEMSLLRPGLQFTDHRTEVPAYGQY